MSNFTKKIILAASMAAMVTLGISQAAIAQPTPASPQPSGTQRYGCMAGYPDHTYRGDRPVSRYEFAAVMNACLEQINQLIETNINNRTTQEELATPAAQLEQYQQQLQDLRQQLDRLEGEN